jgi:DNA (cytosine-5)-methyltransferase 1
MRSIELFTGAGGLALGTHQAGFHHLAVVERDRDSCDTLRLNQQRGLIDWPIREQDVRLFDYSAFPSDIDLLAGGAPCQPFSLGGKHAGQVDPRNMFPEVFKAVRELRPKAFLLENVRGLTRTSFRPYFDYIVEQLTFPHIIAREDEGWEEHKARLLFYHNLGDAVDGPLWGQSPGLRYDIAPPRVYNVADFGVPQQRHRVFIVGFRHDLSVEWSFPEPTHSEDALLYAQYVDNTYWKEHGLESRPVPPRLEKRVRELAARPKPTRQRWRTVRDALGDLPEPVLYQAHPDYDHHVGIPDARIYPGHTGSPWDWPAKAIKAGDHGNPGGENMLRRDDGSVRYFTVRELARLQTFPDDWHFASSWTESRRQLGNAVPVAMAEMLAVRIRTCLEKHARQLTVDAKNQTLVTAD